MECNPPSQLQLQWHNVCLVTFDLQITNHFPFRIQNWGGYIFATSFPYFLVQFKLCSTQHLNKMGSRKQDCSGLGVCWNRQGGEGGEGGGGEGQGGQHHHLLRVDHLLGLLVHLLGEVGHQNSTGLRLGEIHKDCS